LTNRVVLTGKRGRRTTRLRRMVEIGAARAAVGDDAAREHDLSAGRACAHRGQALGQAGYRGRVNASRGGAQHRRELVDGELLERYRLPLVHSGSWIRLLVVAHGRLHARGTRASRTGSEVLHVHNPPDTLSPPGALGRVVGCKSVFDKHDGFPVTQKYASPPASCLLWERYAETLLDGHRKLDRAR
jgi:hypothetical protein